MPDKTKQVRVRAQARNLCGGTHAPACSNGGAEEGRRCRLGVQLPPGRAGGRAEHIPTQQASPSSRAQPTHSRNPQRPVAPLLGSQGSSKVLVRKTCLSALLSESPSCETTAAEAECPAPSASRRHARSYDRACLPSSLCTEDPDRVEPSQRRRRVESRGVAAGEWGRASGGAPSIGDSTIIITTSTSTITTKPTQAHTAITGSRPQSTSPLCKEAPRHLVSVSVPLRVLSRKELNCSHDRPCCCTRTSSTARRPRGCGCVKLSAYVPLCALPASAVSASCSAWPSALLSCREPSTPPAGQGRRRCVWGLGTV